MKTAKEILEDIKREYPSSSPDGQAIIAMHRFARQVIDFAADNAQVLLERNHPTLHRLEVMSYSADGDRFTVSKESILKIKKYIR